MNDQATDEEMGLAGRQPTRQRSSIPSFLFISFMLFMLTSHSGDEFLARHQYQDALQSLTYQLSNFTAWRNSTASNFSLPAQDSKVLPILDLFHVGGGSPVDSSLSSYYSNITGFIHADSRFYNITLESLASSPNASWTPITQKFMEGVNSTEAIQRLGSWNWTASEKVALSVVEKPSRLEGKPDIKDIVHIHGRIEFTDTRKSEELRLEFEGVHFIANGSIYGFAEPPGRHIDIRLLPSLVPDAVKNATAAVIEPELVARIEKLKNLIDAGTIEQESSNDEKPKTTCPFTFYAQSRPVDVPEHLMQELEEEIQRPTGIWTVGRPKLLFDAILISKDCGMMFELVHAEGLRSRIFFRKVTTYAGTASLAYLLLLIIFSRQSEKSRTPNGLSRVSRWTFLAQATIDCVCFAGYITFAILADGRPSLSLIAPAFLACILFIYEAQFSVLVYQIQIPENMTTTAAPANRNPPQPANSAASQPTPAPGLSTQQATTPNINNTPTPTQPETPSFFSFFIHHVRTDPQARLWAILFLFLTFIIRVILSPVLLMLLMSAAYCLIWLPQIVRSARRGRTSGLSKRYIVGTTVSRLYFGLYFLACPKNVLDVEPRSWCYPVAAFVCLQACVLMLQDIFGPAFFLPKKYAAVKAYDYHPPLPLPDPEAPEQSLGDCSICMDAILANPSQRRPAKLNSKEASEVTPEVSTSARATLASASGLFDAMQMGIDRPGAKKHYSLAPCHHLFHTECLEKWLAIKNICPQCRRPLPPL